MTTTKIDRTGESQSVRLPEGFQFDVDEVETDQVLARTDDILERDRRMAEPAFGERVEAMTSRPGVEHIGDQHGVVERA